MNAKHRNKRLGDAAANRRAVLYARVSSREQEKEGFSIPAQLKLLRGYAAEQGIVIAREFIDAETAKRAGRTNFGEMLAFMRRNPACRTVLVEKTDRLYRNTTDWLTVEELGPEIHFVKENVVISKASRSSEKFVHGIKVLVAKNFVDNLAEETRKGLLEKAEEGIYPSYAPIGYRNAVGPSGKNVIEPDPERAPIIARLFEWYDSGNHSIEEITKKAAAAGLTSRQGKPVSKSNIHYALRKRIYTGDFEWAGKTYRGSHQPLISQELFERVQAKLDGRFEGKEKKTDRDFAFSGLVKCGHCGCALVAELKKGRYVYYHCTGRKGKCPEPYTREEVLEEQFADCLKGLAFDDEILEWLSSALRHSHEDARRLREEALARLQAEHDKYQKRLDRLYEDRVDGEIGIEFFGRKSEEWGAELVRISRAMDEHRAAEAPDAAAGASLLELAKRAHELFGKQKPSEKRKLLNFVCSNSTWRGGRLSVNLRQPFDALAVTNAAWENEKAAGAKPGGLRSMWLRR